MFKAGLDGLITVSAPVQTYNIAHYLLAGVVAGAVQADARRFALRKVRPRESSPHGRFALRSFALGKIRP